MQVPTVANALLEAWHALTEGERIEPDFWSAVGAGEREMYRSLALMRLHDPLQDINAMFAALDERAPGVRPWSSVRDTVEIVFRIARMARGMAQQAQAAERLLKQVDGYSAGVL